MIFPIESINKIWTKRIFRIGKRNTHIQQHNGSNIFNIYREYKISIKNSTKWVLCLSYKISYLSAAIKKTQHYIRIASIFFSVDLCKINWMWPFVLFPNWNFDLLIIYDIIIIIQGIVRWLFYEIIWKQICTHTVAYIIC